MEGQYGVFYNIIGTPYSDAGDAVFNHSDLNIIMEFYNTMESKCDFIQIWDRQEQKTLKQKGQ